MVIQYVTHESWRRLTCPPSSPNRSSLLSPEVLLECKDIGPPPNTRERRRYHVKLWIIRMSIPAPRLLLAIYIWSIAINEETIHSIFTAKQVVAPLSRGPLKLQGDGAAEGHVLAGSQASHEGAPKVGGAIGMSPFSLFTQGLLDLPYKSWPWQV